MCTGIEMGSAWVRTALHAFVYACIHERVTKIQFAKPPTSLRPKHVRIMHIHHLWDSTWKNRYQPPKWHLSLENSLWTIGALINAKNQISIKMIACLDTHCAVLTLSPFGSRCPEKYILLTVVQHDTFSTATAPNRNPTALSITWNSTICVETATFSLASFTLPSAKNTNFYAVYNICGKLNVRLWLSFDIKIQSIQRDRKSVV